VGNDSINYDNKIFSKIYKINSTAKARFGISTYWHYLKKAVGKVIKEVKPDIVHAHNIFSAKMVSEFGLPFIYDDHEYWSQYSKTISEMADTLSWKDKSATNIIRTFAIDLPVKVRRIIRNRYALYLWTKWEKEVVSSAPTITVSDKIAEQLRVLGNTGRVFVVPNFPMKFETENIEKPRIHSRLSSVYAGSDGLNKQKVPSRNIDGITDTFINENIGELTIIGWEGRCSSKKITYTGCLSRQAMFSEMSKHSIGLLPWKKHWSHGFASPNKAYEYAHAGLHVMCTSSFEPVLRILKDNCTSFQDYNDLVSKLEYFRDNPEELYKRRLRIFDFARNNLIWENYEKNIFRAYQLC
jgi:glycosyltransferase involved in cell wall biosynthesis